ncbi:hypothetical protein K7711_31815 [Nocardia sp. CA2R105]|uniref:tetratricopeptide repeat protein n=1 Tax=Nocardia coffeae TaxID=2873381 RepID=UPI001CA747FD|nr:hypothetical protein [Nocardia coffeae]MBY8861101.1 hypothetical protein [Nocardia coffeae]
MHDRPKIASSNAGHHGLDLDAAPPVRYQPAVTDPKIAVLPFRDLHWEDFERLVLDLARVDDNLQPTVRRYGVAGQEQSGVDIVGCDADGNKHAYQVKKVERFTQSQARKALETFVSGGGRFEARSFVIATACPGTRAEVYDLIEEFRSAHPRLGVDHIWDAEYLSARLRKQPDIVGRYFGDQTVTRFCDVTPMSAAALVGTPLSQVQVENFGIHETIRAATGGGPETALTPYVRREFDIALEAAVSRAADGHTTVVILVGDSSTGKGRAIWQALQALPPNWRLWQPRAFEEVLHSDRPLAPRTVLWLDEVKNLLLSGRSEHDEQVAAALARLVHAPASRPVLAIGAAWHEHWVGVTRPSSRRSEDRTNTRALLHKARIEVPEYFTEADITAVLQGPSGTDARMCEAVDQAEDHHITQYLAGGLSQLERYDDSYPEARAVLHAAVDARRLGGPSFCLDEKFLAAAAESALTALRRDLLAPDWFDEVIAYTSAPCRGARGVLSRARARGLPGGEHRAGLHLADYPEQVISQRRMWESPGEGFWIAAEHFVVSVRDLLGLTHAAVARGLIDVAIRLARRSAKLGDAHGLLYVGNQIAAHHRDHDPVPLFEAAAIAGVGPAQVEMGIRCEDLGQLDDAEHWYRTAVDNGDTPSARVGLGAVLWKRGDHLEAQRQYEHALRNGDTKAVEYQARRLAVDGHHEEALELTRLTFHAGNRNAFTGLAWRYVYTDRKRAVAVLAHALAEGDGNALRELMVVFEIDGRMDKVRLLCDRAVELEQWQTLGVAARLLAQHGEFATARGTLWRAYNGGLRYVLSEIAELHEREGSYEIAERLYHRSLDESGGLAALSRQHQKGRAGVPVAVFGLMRVLEHSGRGVEAEAVAGHAPAAYVPHLAGLRAEDGDVDGALRLLMALADAGDPDGLVDAARIMERSGDPAEATRFLERAQSGGSALATSALNDRKVRHQKDAESGPNSLL